MLHAMNDRARPKEKQSLKESVGNQMESRSDISTNTCGSNHVTKLRNGRVGEHTFDIVLSNRNRGGKQGSERTDEGDYTHRRGQFVTVEIRRQQREHTDDRVDTSRHHRGCMNHRTDRRWAFHRIGQPNMQRPLRGFTDRPDEQQ